MMDFGITGIAAITVLCFLAAQGAKELKIIGNKWLPFVCGSIGGVLGVIGMYIMPDYPATDWITAAAVGVVSGLAATGAHQMYKQVKG